MPSSTYSPGGPMPDIVRLSMLNFSVSHDESRTRYTYHVYPVPGARDAQEKEQWKRIKKLGSGSFGAVYLEKCSRGQETGTCRAAKDGSFRAVKVIQRPKAINYYRELEALSYFSYAQHERCFVKSFGWFEDENQIYIAMEYLDEGDLDRHLDTPLIAKESQVVVRQLVEGLGFMHDNGFVHRDLKPANILVKCKGPDWWVKIADFGISKRVTQELSELRSAVGTPAFMAPEILGSRNLMQEDTYTNAVDMWALGMIAFLLLTGKTRFHEQIQLQLKRYVHGVVDFPESMLAQAASHTGCQFVRRMLAVDPKARLSAAEAQNHPWLRVEQIQGQAPIQSQVQNNTRDSFTTGSVAGSTSSYEPSVASAAWSNLSPHTSWRPPTSRPMYSPAVARAARLRNAQTSQTRPPEIPAKPTTLRSSPTTGAASIPGRAAPMPVRPMPPIPESSISATSTRSVAHPPAPSVPPPPIPSLPVNVRVSEVSSPGPTRPAQSEDKVLPAPPKSKTIATSRSSPCLAPISATPTSPPSAATCGDLPRRHLSSEDSSEASFVPTLESQNRPSKFLSHKGAVVCLAFSQDGSVLASGFSDGLISLRDVTTGGLVQSYRARAHCNIRRIVVSDDLPGGRAVFSISSGKDFVGVEAWQIGKQTLAVDIRDGVRHSSYTAFALSSDGRLAVVGSHDGALAAWDIQRTLSLRHWAIGLSEESVSPMVKVKQHAVVCVAISPNKKWIAAASQNGTIRVVRQSTAFVVRTLEAQKFDQAWGLRFSADNKRLVFSSWKPPYVLIWDVATGSLLRSFSGRATMSPATSLFAEYIDNSETRKGADLQVSGAQPGATRVKVSNYASSEDWATAMLFSPNGELLAVGHSGGTVQLWWHGYAALAEVPEVPGARPKFSKRWTALTGLMRKWGPGNAEETAPRDKDSPDSEYLSVSSSLNEDSTEPSLQGRSLGTTIGTSIGTTSDYTRSKGTEEIDQNTPRVFEYGELTPHITHVAFCPDSSSLAIACEAGRVIIRQTTPRLLAQRTGDPLEFQMKGPVKDLRFSPDGLSFFAMSEGRSSNEVHVWGWSDSPWTRSLEVIYVPFAKLAPSFKTPSACRLSPDGHSAIFGSKQGNLCHLDLRSRKVLWESQPSPIEVTSLDFSADSGQIAVGFRNGGVQVLNAKTGAARWKSLAHLDVVRSVEFSSDGLKLLTLSRWACLWEIATGSKLGTFSACRVAMSPDMTLIATFVENRGAWTSVELRDAASAAIVHSKLLTHANEGHEGGFVQDIKFSHDGMMLAIAQSDGTTKIWKPFADS